MNVHSTTIAPRRLDALGAVLAAIVLAGAP